MRICALPGCEKPVPEKSKVYPPRKYCSKECSNKGIKLLWNGRSSSLKSSGS